MAPMVQSHKTESIETPIKWRTNTMNSRIIYS